MMKKRTILGLIFVLLVAILVVACSQAEEPQHATPVSTPSDDDINAIAKNMFCPVCESTPLDVCGTAACAEWREEIGDKLALGWSEEEIYDFFQNKHGDRVLAKPPAEGFNWLLYVLPPAAIAIGAYFLLRFLLQSSPKKEAAAAQPALDDDAMARLESELKQRDE